MKNQHTPLAFSIDVILFGKLTSSKIVTIKEIMYLRWLEI